MKKWMKFCICGMAAAMLISGCGKKAENKETTAAESTTAADTAGTETTEAAKEEVKGDGLSKIVTLGEYKGLEVEKPSTEVTDEELQSQLDSIVAANPNSEEVTDRPVQDGDIVNLTYVGKKEDGTEFDSNTVDLTIGSGQFIDGFEEGLIGAELGSEVTLNLTFPEGYFEESLSGQPAVFDVTINKITVETEATLDDAFVNRITDGEYTTADEYRQFIKDSMTEQKENMAEEDMFYNILEQIATASEFDVTEADLNAKKAEIQDYYNTMASMYGITVEMMTGKTTEEIETIVNDSAKQTIEWNLILTEVANKENLALQDEDYEEIAKSYGYETAEEMKAVIPESNIEEALLIDKVSPVLIEYAVVK